ncbi:MAG: hypothetical protein QM831_40965 [Kofleriaceae bacterium]
MRVLVLIALGACITPSIPIPPPDPGQMDFDVQMGSDGGSTATFTYPPDHNYAGGTAYIFNEANNGGVFHLVNPDNSIGPLTLPAKLGDQVVVTIEGGEQTVSRCVVLRQGAQDPNTYCQ